MKKFVQWLLVFLRLKPHPKREYDYVRGYYLYNEQGQYLEALEFDLRNFSDLQGRLSNGQAYFLVFEGRYSATHQLTSQNIIDRASWVVVKDKVYAINNDRYYYNHPFMKLGELRFPVLMSDGLKQFIKIPKNPGRLTAGVYGQYASQDNDPLGF